MEVFVMTKIALATLAATLHITAASAQTAPPSPPQELYLAGQLGLGYVGCSSPKPTLKKVSGPVSIPKNDLGQHSNINGAKGQVGPSVSDWKRRIVTKYGQPSYVVGFSASCPVKETLIYSDRIPFGSYEEMSCVASFNGRPNPQFVMKGQASVGTNCKSRRIAATMMVVSIMQDGDAVIVSGGNYKDN
jgi:hypothetical protein